MSKKRILFVINSLNMGGVERALIALANSLIENYDVSVFIIDGNSIDLLGELSNKVHVLFSDIHLYNYYICDKKAKNSLNIKQIAYKAFIRLLGFIHLKKTFEKLIANQMKNISCDIVISYTGYPGPWDTAAELVKATERFVYIHNNPIALGLNKIDINKYYKQFDKILCVSKDIKKQVASICPDISDKLFVSYNLIDKSRIDRKASEKNPYIDKNKKIVLTIARIENRSKRFDRLIEVAKLIKQKGYFDYVWYIVGDGPDSNDLKRWIIENGLKDFIKLEGVQDNPYKYMKNADVFVLTSDYEGLPVTLMEARYLKLPAITTNFTCANEIIIDNVTGYVCSKSICDLADAIITVLYNDELRNNLSISLAKDELLLEGDYSFNN